MLIGLLFVSHSICSQNSDNKEIMLLANEYNLDRLELLVDMEKYRLNSSYKPEEFSVEVNSDHDLFFLNGTSFIWKNTLTYTSGELPLELVWKKYFGETAEINYQSAIEYQLTNNLTVGLQSNWSREVSFNGTQLFSLDKNRQIQLNVSYSYSNWALELKAQQLRVANWVDVVTDINNQPLGEVKESGQAIFHPDEPWSLIGTFTYNF